MKRAIPPITESVEQLQALLKAEKHPRRRERLQMLYLLKTKQAQTRKQAADPLVVHRATIGRWLDTYAAQGREGLLAIKSGGNNPLSIPQEVLEQLSQKLKEPEGFPSYKAIQHWLVQAHGLQLPYSTVHHIVRYRLKAKPKVGRPSHAKQDPQQVAQFKTELKNRFQKVAAPLFLGAVGSPNPRLL